LPFPPRAAKSPDHITDPHPFWHVKQNEFTAQKGTAPTSSSSKRKAGRRDRPRRCTADQRDELAPPIEPYAKGRFLRDQVDAAKNRRGIWKGCFAAPTDWRRWKKDAPLMGSACPSDAASHIFGCRIKGNQRSKKYHHPGCPAYDSISAKNVAKMFCSEDEARAEGYTKAGNCPP